MEVYHAERRYFTAAESRKGHLSFRAADQRTAGRQPGSVCDAQWPSYNEEYLKENDMQLTISFNGKARFQMSFPVDTPNDEIQKQVLADEKSQKYLEGFNVLKVIIVPKKIVNVVLKK